MEKVVIIGGGASGLITAIYAKKKNNQVIILEKNSICGKKLLITGNGRCNWWNKDQNIKHYHSTNLKQLSTIIQSKNQKEILLFFEKIGLTSRIKDGYYYPFSNQSITIQHALLLEAKVRKIDIRNEVLVKQIQKTNNQFFIQTNKGTIKADRVVLATGSKANPKTGSDGSGYQIATNFGHSLVPVLPSLVSIIGKGNYFSKWNGIRTEVSLTLYEEDIIIKQEKGEIQLTKDGISGICVFNLSRFVSIGLYQNKKEYIKINFLPFLTSKKECENWINEQNNKVNDRTIEELLEATLHYKLVSILLKKSGISKNKNWNQCTIKQKNMLIESLISFHFDILATNSFEKAQVCSGGIQTAEVDFNTMESKIIPNLYIVGEILDVDGDCGGYNLGFAWMSGMLAGKAIGGSTYDSSSTSKSRNSK